MSKRELNLQRDAIGRLSSVLPASDNKNSWYDDYRLAMHRLQTLKWRYGLIAVPLLIAGFSSISFAIAWLFPGTGAWLGISTGIVSIALASVAMRKTLSALPSFGWAREYDHLVELLPPFKEAVEQLAGRDWNGALEL